jgi:tetratricopeptide (TPR) repeat protein
MEQFPAIFCGFVHGFVNCRCSIITCKQCAFPEYRLPIKGSNAGVQGNNPVFVNGKEGLKMLKTIQKRIIFVLVVSMFLQLFVGVLPVAAEDPDDQKAGPVGDVGEGTEGDPMASAGFMAAGGYAYIDEKGEIQNTGDKPIAKITASSSTLYSGWYVVDDNVFTGNTITVYGDVHLILADGSSLTANTSGYAGINVSRNNSLTIYAQSKGDRMGALNAAGQLAAGIGGNYGDCGKITINGELRIWFQALNDAAVKLNPAMLVAKGAFLSVLGNFVQAKACLEAAIPLMNREDKELYFEAMIHMARVLRNFVSFEESNKLLDELIAKLEGTTGEPAYSVVIEKLYNLCWNSKIGEAYALARHMIESCANAGNIKTMRWFERYLCTIHFFAGRMKDSVYYYEKSLELPKGEQNFLGVHSTGIYAAKAYQMLGERSRSLSVLSEELGRLRNTGNYEEMWAGYLLAAEIHYQNTLIDKINGENASYETAIKYFTLADEYAPLYRKTNFQMHWAKMQRLTYSLIFTDGPKENVIREILENLDRAGAYLKSLVLARLMGYFTAISDYSNAVRPSGR